MHYGFLILNPWQLSFASPLAQSLSNLAKNIPALLQAKQLRAEVNALNPQAPLAITTEEQPRMRVILLMLAQAYVWQEVQETTVNLPAILADNILLLCQNEHPPVLTYAEYILNNWELCDPDLPITLNNVRPIFTFTGSLDEAWFIKIHVVFEAQCAAAITAALQIGSMQDNGRRVEYLKQITVAMQQAIATLNRLNEHCRPDYFFNVLRPYLNGWKNVALASQIYSDGVGPSGAQSSVLPALDAILGIEHSNQKIITMADKLFQYMPAAERNLILQMRQNSIKDIIKHSAIPDLKTAWQQAVSVVGEFRLQHIQLAAKYTAGAMTGTGGTPMGAYLGGRYRATQAVEEVNESKIRARL